MLVYMLDLPSDWTFRLEHLSQLRKSVGHGNGRDAVSAVVKELQDAGYLRIEIQRKSGRFHTPVWHVADRPIFRSRDKRGPEPGPDFPDAVKPAPEIQGAENPSLHTTDRKHYSSLLESGGGKSTRRSSAGSGVGRKQKHLFLRDPTTNIHYEQGNLPDTQALALIKRFSSEQIQQAVERAQRQDDRGRAFPSATLRQLNKVSRGSSEGAPAWATMDKNPPVVAAAGEYIEAEFTEEEE
jgi:hypothetical protein